MTLRAHSLLRYLLGALAALSAQCWAQAAVPAAELKVAYLYHFIQYTDWPEEMLQNSETLQVCAAADDPLLPALAALEKKFAHSKTIAVKIALNAAALQQCQVLLLSADGSAPDRIIGVLTVADADAMTRHDAMITLLVTDSRVVFAVNNTLARTSGLKISSKLLRLAKSVR